MNISQIISNPVDVVNRLEAFGLTKDDLLEVVDAAVAARRSCTENDPPSAAGWMSWCHGTRRLREVTGRHGYARDDSDSIASAYDSRRGIKIAVSNTDDGTGVEDRMPQQRSKKGPATDRVVDLNEASLFAYFGLDDTTRRVVPLTTGKRLIGAPMYWYLCIFCEGDDVRAELSCPVNSEGGFFADFYERIILIGSDNGDGGARIRLDTPELDGGFEIPVIRKQA